MCVCGGELCGFCVYVCVCVCVRACVRACACVRARARMCTNTVFLCVPVPCLHGQHKQTPGHNIKKKEEEDDDDDDDDEENTA